MTATGINPLDALILVIYLVVIIWLGKRAAASARNQEGFFLAGRKLGKVYQFFLNFGNATDANGAVSTASLVYQQGVSGVWLSFQTVFMNPYYWFMNLWFRRARLVTTADLFEDRFASRGLGSFYALFQIGFAIILIGFANLVSYKVSASLVVKPAADYSVAERASVEGFREWKQLEQQASAGALPAAAQARLETLRSEAAKGELRSYVSVLSAPWFYLGYTAIVGLYIVLGGMAATALNEAFQGVLIVIFSVLLVPVGIHALGGVAGFRAAVPRHMFDLFGESTRSAFTWYSVLAILLVSIVQIHGILGNMGISGSARTEFAARFGAVSGTYAKRFMIILWAFVGLIALGLYHGDLALADPDAAWGMMSARLLGPGLLGLMMAGILAANMSSLASQTVGVSALFVRNLYRHRHPDLTEAQGVRAARWAIVIVLALGVLAALVMSNIISVLELILTVNVPFGAAVFLVFFWRRLTKGAVWACLVLSIVVTMAVPIMAPLFPAVRRDPSLVRMTAPANGAKPAPMFFAAVARVDPKNPASPLEGRGRFNLEAWLMDHAGLDVARMSASGLLATRFFFDGLFPFAVLGLASFLTRATEPERVERFHGKMKTPVGVTPELDAQAMAATARDPRRFDHTKLFPRSQWEFTRWNRIDAIGFFTCCLVSGGIIGIFWLLLHAVA